MSSSRPPSGIGKDPAAWVRATATGSVSSSSTAPSRIRVSSARVSSSLATLTSSVERAVADVVDAPRERVQRRHRAALGRRQQPDAVGEVTGLLPGDGLAVAVGGEYRCGRVWCRLHGPDHPSPRRVTPTSRSNWSLPGLGGPGSTSYSAAAIARTAALPPATNPASSSFSLPWTLPTRGAPSFRRSRALCGFVRNQRAHRRAGGFRGEVRLLDVKTLHVRGGQVDAVAAEVLGDVLEVLDDLQRRADRVGAADPLGRRGAGDGEDETADGVGGELAVGEEVVVGLVPADQLVLAVGGDQAEERLGGQGAAADGRLQAAQQGVARGRSRRRGAGRPRRRPAGPGGPRPPAGTRRAAGRRRRPGPGRRRRCRRPDGRSRRRP